MFRCLWFSWWQTVRFKHREPEQSGNPVQFPEKKHTRPLVIFCSSEKNAKHSPVQFSPRYRLKTNSYRWLNKVQNRSRLTGCSHVVHLSQVSGTVDWNSAGGEMICGCATWNLLSVSHLVHCDSNRAAKYITRQVKVLIRWWINHMFYSKLDWIWI